MPKPRDGRDGRDGLDGKDGERGPRGLKGERGEPGQRGADGRDGRAGEPGQPGRDAVLVPALATFERDSATKLTTRVDVADMDTGAAILSIVPIRESGLMVAAQIIPA